MIHTKQTKNKAILLRRKGFTYSEIQNKLSSPIPKGTLSGWFNSIKLTNKQQKRINKIIKNNLKNARLLSVEKSAQVRHINTERLIDKHDHLKSHILDKNTAMVAFSLLCLGEASKTSSNNGSFYLGSSDPRIIHLFIGLLKICFPFDMNKFRCTVQCRADQDQKKLEIYWQKKTNIPKKNFYKTRIDPRTKGKRTLNKEYMGVLRVDYFDSRVPKNLDVLYNLLSESVWNDYLGR